MAGPCEVDGFSLVNYQLANVHSTSRWWTVYLKLLIHPDWHDLALSTAKWPAMFREGAQAFEESLDKKGHVPSRLL